MDVNIIGGTIAAPEHQRKFDDNHDAQYILQEGPYTVFGVSDGGDDDDSTAIGSSIAVSTAVAETMDTLLDKVSPEEAIRRGVRCAADTLRNRADHQYLRCTLALGVLTEKGWFICTTGGSFAVISETSIDHSYVQNNGKLVDLMDSHGGLVEIASGNTVPLAITLSTDGLARSALSMNVPLSRFWNPLVKEVLEGTLDIQSFLYHMADKERIKDDVTILVAVPEKN